MTDANTVLSKPPIQEAIFDIRFSTSTENVLDKISVFADKVKDRYPNKKDKIEFKMQFDPKMGEPAQTPDGKRIVGCLLRNDENRKIIQTSTNSFSCHLLPPYAVWDELFDMMQTEWRLFSGLLEDVNIERVGVRYINSIEFDFEQGDLLVDYLRLTPAAPSDLPQTLDNYFLQVTMPFDDHYKANVTSTLRSITNGRVNVLLDIDVFHLNSNVDMNDIFNTLFPEMRKIKNRIFYSVATPKALKNYY